MDDRIGKQMKEKMGSVNGVERKRGDLRVRRGILSKEGERVDLLDNGRKDVDESVKKKGGKWKRRAREEDPHLGDKEGDGVGKRKIIDEGNFMLIEEGGDGKRQKNFQSAGETGSLSCREQ